MSLALLFYLSLESLSALVSLVPFISEMPYMLVFQCLLARNLSLEARCSSLCNCPALCRSWAFNGPEGAATRLYLTFIASCFSQIALTTSKSNFSMKKTTRRAMWMMTATVVMVLGREQDNTSEETRWGACSQLCYDGYPAYFPGSWLSFEEQHSSRKDHSWYRWAFPFIMWLLNQLSHYLGKSRELPQKSVTINRRNHL